MIIIRRVVGGSMRPTLKPGRLIIAIRRRPRLGDVVVAAVDGREVIKRIVGAEAQTYELVGDHADSARYQSVERSHIYAVLIWPRVNAPRRVKLLAGK